MNRSVVVIQACVSALFLLLGCDRAKPVTSKALEQGEDATRTAPNVKEERWATARLPFERSPPSKPRGLREEDLFEDVTEVSGVRWTYRNGYEARFFTLLETVGGGAALWDFDCDGDLDLFVAGGGQLSGPPIEIRGLPSVLYRNEGEWRFRDVTSEMGLDTSRMYSHGCAVGDFDRDGYSDLVVSGFGSIQ